MNPTIRNIYFAPTPWASAASVLSDYKFQTPGNSGIWHDIRATDDPSEAEFLVIQDECYDQYLINSFPSDKRLYFNREALAKKLKSQYKEGDFVRFSFWDGTGYLPVRWSYRSEQTSAGQGYSGLPGDYDYYKGLQPLEKDRGLCSILSNKSMTQGHRIRKRFTKAYMFENELDLYGSVKFRTKEMPNNDKSLVLANYRYCLGFDNQDSIDNFIGTQFTDALLYWTVPIFWCGTDLSRYYPEGSFLQFDARNKSEISRIATFLEQDDYSKRIPALREARNLVLDKYNFWPTIESVVHRNKHF